MSIELVVICGLSVLFVIYSAINNEVSARRYERREKTLYSLYRNMSNRLHAATLSGYMALEDEDKTREEPTPPLPVVVSDDEREAMIEQERLGLRLQ